MRKIFCLIVLAFSINAEEIFNLSIKDALESEAAKKYILPNVKVEFGSGYNGERIVVGATASRKQRGDIGEKVEKCQIAFLDAVNAFQRRNQREGGTKAVNIVSFLYGKEFSSKTEFQCLYTNKYTVRLQGDIAK